MQQRELTLESTRFINLDEILDPYERMQGDYYLVEIAKAEYCDHREIKYIEFIALELVVVERNGSLNDKEKYKFKGKKLFLNISLDPKKVWLLKNLCNALNISGKCNLKELAVILTGMKVKARVLARYDVNLAEYFHVINKFK